MGEVYRARDSQLKREVALKTLPAGVTGDAERLARFQREAEVLAALNHPNIAQIHGLADGLVSGVAVRALVMALVEGDDLSQRIAATGPVPIPEALAIARQIALALDYAHERGIVHRDLKPANIKVTPDGAVKVLDFGLAKAIDPGAGSGDPGAAQERANSPTLTSPAMTQRGMILGTAAYMSPEQAKGKLVDKRSDIWAFGCVLFEMITGKRTFDGEDVTDSIVAVMSRDPAWQTLPATTPPAIRKLLRRCLETDRSKRLADIRDALFEIDEALAQPVGGAESSSTTMEAASARQKAGWLLAGVAIAAAVVAVIAQTGLWPRAGVSGGTSDTTVASVLRTSVDLPADGPLALGSRRSAMGFDDPAVSLSPDGSFLAYVSRSTAADTALSVVDLATGRARVLAGTEGALHSFFSPDSRQLGFVTRDRLKTIPVEGGAAKTLAEARTPTIGRWLSDDVIYFTETEGATLSRVAAAGGKPESLLSTVLESAITDVLPGDPVLLVEGVAMDSLFSIVHASTSRNGLLAHVAGGNVSIGRPSWVDRKGAVTALDLPPRVYGVLSLTRDGHRMAIHVADAADHIWIYDLDRNVGRRLASPDPAGWPVWSRDGRRLAVTRFTLGSGFSSRVRDVEGAAQDLAVDQAGAQGAILDSWSAGNSVAFVVDGTPPRVLLGLLGGPPPQLSFRGFFPTFSPDGRWLAYSSDETGLSEVYVGSLPDGKVTRQVSNGGGIEAQWLPNGDLFYRAGQRWFATRVSTEPSLRWDPDPPRLVFDTDFVDTPGRSYAVSPDGQRLLVVKAAGPPIDQGRISLIVNLRSAIAK